MLVVKVGMGRGRFRVTGGLVAAMCEIICDFWFALMDGSVITT